MFNDCEHMLRDLYISQLKITSDSKKCRSCKTYFLLHIFQRRASFSHGPSKSIYTSWIFRNTTLYAKVKWDIAQSQSSSRPSSLQISSLTIVVSVFGYKLLLDYVTVI